MNFIYDELREKNSLWCINGELGIYFSETDHCEYYSDEYNNWKKSPWTAHELCAYQNYPQVEFLGFLE